MTDTDKELLEDAARAAGLDYRGYSDEYGLRVTNSQYEWWNPLDDDEQAFRLAVKLNLTVACREHETEVFSEHECLESIGIFPGQDDPGEITRHAIVRAAAAIGKQKG